MNQGRIAKNLATVEAHFHSEAANELIRDGYWHFPVGSKVEMRLVHIFEMRDGKIARELVYDMGRVL